MSSTFEVVCINTSGLSSDYIKEGQIYTAIKSNSNEEHYGIQIPDNKDYSIRYYYKFRFITKLEYEINKTIEGVLNEKE